MQRRLKVDVAGDGFFIRAGSVVSEKWLANIIGEAGCARLSEPANEDQEIAIKPRPPETAVRKRGRR